MELNLLVSLPKQLKEEEVLYALPFDINEEAKAVKGHCVVDTMSIAIYIDEKRIKEFIIDQFDEYECIQQNGSCMLLGKNADTTTYLCAFTHTHFLRYAEMVKLLNYYKEYGRFIKHTDADEPTCPNCGLPLDGASVCPYCVKKSTYLKRLVRMIGPYKGFFIAAVICTILANLIAIVRPFLQRMLIDEYITKMKAVDTRFVQIAAAMGILVLFNWLFDFVNMKASSTVALSLGRDIRMELFRKTQRLSMAAVSKRTPGDLINRVNSDANKLQDFITANGKDMIVRLFSIVSIGVILFVLDPFLAVLVIIPVPFVALITNRLFTIMRTKYGRQWRLRTRYSSLLHDILNGIREVKSYGNEKREIKRFENASEAFMKSCRRAELTWNLTVPFVWFILSIGTYFVVYFAGYSVLEEKMTLGYFVMYYSFVCMIYEPLEWLLRLPKLLADTTVSAVRVFEIMDEVDDIKEKEEPVKIDIKGNIKFEDVSFGYKVYHPVLKNINCEIKQGEMIGIVGHSGVGKSTMINLIMRLYDCTAGDIKIDGVSLRDISQESLRSQIGVVLQETYLFEGSVYDNIRYSKPDATFEEIIQAAKIANAHEFITKLPDGYNTRVGNKGHSLSGGERQRIAIARAILHNPRILILDEATASLDTQTERQIQEALNRLIKGRTTIAIAHRLSTLSNADRLFVLDQGKLVEAGTHTDLLQKKGVYYRLVMAQRQTAKLKKIKTAV